MSQSRGTYVGLSRRAISRRQFFGLGGATAAGAALAAARLVAPLSRGEALRAPANLPVFQAHATAPSGQVLRFRSRPDLQIAAPQVDIDLAGQDSGLILTDTHAGPGEEGPLILDGTGQVVWFAPVSPNASPAKRAMNLRAGTYQGKPVLSWWEGAVVNEHGEGHYLIADSSYSTIKTVEAGNGYQGDLHEFFLTPEGTAFFTCVGLSSADLTPYGGKANGSFYYGVAQEVDVATGEVLFQWRSDQFIGFDESYSTPSEFGTEPWDYFHLNSIGIDGTGDLLLSSRNCWALYKVSRATGEVLWRMGGKKSDFVFGPGAQYAWQHDATPQPDASITVFDNGAGLEVTEPQSRGLVLRPDFATMRVDLVHQYLHPDGGILANALGSVQLLADGHAFVGWGKWAAFSEFDESGQALLDGRLAGNLTLGYRAFRSSWTGAPTEPPALVLEPTAAGVTLFASWNGATEVQTWLVLGGRARDSLLPLGTAAKAGFETQVEVPSRPKCMAVSAHDANGFRLGISEVLPTGP